MRYIKKPVAVKAFRLDRDPFPDWFMEAFRQGKLSIWIRADQEGKSGHLPFYLVQDQFGGLEFKAAHAFEKEFAPEGTEFKPCGVPGCNSVGSEHPCPYQQEINGNDTPCSCCDDCTQNCADDI